MKDDVLGIRRRDFLVMAAGTMAAHSLFGTPDGDAAPLVRFGLVADLHYADREPYPHKADDADGWTSRYYRESIKKLGESVAVFNRRKVDFAIELGDLKDLTRNSGETMVRLEEVESVFARFAGARYHVAGNHDFDCLTPDEFFSRTPNDGKTTKTGWYSFERGGVRFVVLNACFTASMEPYCRCNPWDDANVPPNELAWLEGELAAARGHVVVFCHQRIDDAPDQDLVIKNAAKVRDVLERSGKVRAVVMGHDHAGGVSTINGIPYYTLRAMSCGMTPDENSFAEGAVYPSGAFTAVAWGKAAQFDFRGARSGNRAGEMKRQGEKS